MGLLIFYLFLAILVSFICSILEAVLLSVTPSYIGSMKNKTGERLKKIKKDIDRPLAAILSLNTIAHTIGAAGVGAQATIIFGEAYIGLISALLTLAILIFSEIIPKTLGATYWRSMTKFSVFTLEILIIVMYPLVILSQGITNILSKKEGEATVSRAEVTAMAELGHQEGIFEESESRVIKNLIRLRSITVENIMTPRTVVIAASEDKTVTQVYKNKKYMHISRIPIYKENLDNVTGYIHKHDLLDKMANDEHELPVKEIKRSIQVVPENTYIPTLFEQLMSTREQIALAVDEYGGMAGIVTMEDIIETLLGMEIVDEFDSAHDMQAFARKKWRDRAKKLGILTDEVEAEKVAKYGITGGQKPRE